ncbi:MAG: glucosyl-3-phosphoglycerate synthase [Acidimicrobiales bacterium]|nr:glucosyl-3-phosphoglycerate synthase [Acidimicrobiales bacterium]
MLGVGLRSFHHDHFDAARLVAEKQAQGQTVSVCLPARDEATTIGAIVSEIHRHLVEGVPLVDEIVVVDDASSDQTHELATAAGARVVAAADCLADVAPGPGKGQALWKGLAETDGDLVVFCDADVRNFGPRFVSGLVGPLLLDPEVALVKAFYERPLDGERTGGGRVTELVARPLIAALFPELTGVAQPLAGESASRRQVLEQLPFVHGYGFELALLLDVASRYGVRALAQVDLGVREHRNRPLGELSPMSLAVLQAGLSRAGMLARTSATLVGPGIGPKEVALAECPPLADLPSYRRRLGA